VYLPAALPQAQVSVRSTVAWSFSCQKYTRVSDSFQGELAGCAPGETVGILRSRIVTDAMESRDGRWLEAADIVLVRQRPGSAASSLDRVDVQVGKYAYDQGRLAGEGTV
jgi:hypothetical protein